MLNVTCFCPRNNFCPQNQQAVWSALGVTSATASARSKTCDVLCIPARNLVTLALLSGGVCSPLLHFLAKTELEKNMQLPAEWSVIQSI